MTAVLCRHFGLKHIEIAEDITSETFLKAVEHWTTKGVPANPAAWLYAVARNKAKDYLKRIVLYDTQIKEAIGPNETIEYFEFNDQNISDSQLAMIFAVCSPANSPEAQICLALQILCGFSTEEITDAFLAKPETIKKRLQRAKANLRKDNFQLKNLSETEINSRSDTVLRTLYIIPPENRTVS
ncbi:RNA polymerase sigma factor (sigma-70 family) [Anseongella ginsenosidimutans]|uniref:RNA polymerase sigma factor (Sigma-70 family) n=2 Tax=Anseongella ginsenosidimutans TaxID=496056 RepID=A0A4R3KLF4_9SPHI|nr:RNA polymerase sigma factor (sigma-70 family) [Anseongella ginsenosidimutans]